MPRSLSDRLAGVHPKMLAIDGDVDRKKVADLRRRIGQLVERALTIAGVTKQEAAFAMGYRDAVAISRWCAGVERPLFDKLFTLADFEWAWIVALAERNPAMETETVVKIRRGPR